MQESARTAPGVAARQRPLVAASTRTASSTPMSIICTCSRRRSPKEGASAGVTMAAALVSAATRHRIRAGVAMSGEQDALAGLQGFCHGAVPSLQRLDDAGSELRMVLVGPLSPLAITAPPRCRPLRPQGRRPRRRAHSRLLPFRAVPLVPVLLPPLPGERWRTHRAGAPYLTEPHGPGAHQRRVHGRVSAPGGAVSTSGTSGPSRRWSTPWSCAVPALSSRTPPASRGRGTSTCGSFACRDAHRSACSTPSTRTARPSC